MGFNKDHAIIAQNATGAAAQVVAAIITANPDHDGGTTTESALKLFDIVRTHIHRGTIALAGGAAEDPNPGAVEFLGGKHAGKTIAEVHDEDPTYITWVADKGNKYMKGKAKEFLQA